MPKQQQAGLPRPLAAADLGRVKAIFADVDGTLTTRDRLESRTIAALEALAADGVRVVLVSGRPAGWGECWLRQLPVAGVIVENGGLYFARDRAGRVRKVYPQPLAERARARSRLLREVAAAMRAHPGARLSSDSAHTEVDIAIDYNEDVKLGTATAARLERFLRARGVSAVRSSVHVNCWIGRFDKLHTVKLFLRREWKTSLKPNDARFAYVGDSFNDAQMFAGFALSIGVANIAAALPHLDAVPRFITRRAEGPGFCELATAVRRAR